MTKPGKFAIVLHTHMPYVEGGGEWPPRDEASFLRNPEGFGTWPFGEEWLWEAIATCYVPLLDVLERAEGRLTLSLTPVLCDQLEAPGAIGRCATFLRDIRPESHRLDIVTADAPVAAVLERSAARYAAVAERLDGLDLPAALGRYARFTSSATHALLPLLATDAGVRLQVATGIAAHRARCGGWNGGFWLPECGYAPWLDPLLAGEGVHVTCVDLTDHFGYGDARQLRPLRSDAGLLLAPIDRAVIELVWHPSGYPSHGAYRDTHRLTEHRHQAWSVDGRPYDEQRALDQARAHAEHFAAAVARRVAGGGLSVCALDTELLGHWWPEGVAWLGFVLDALARAGVELVALDEWDGAETPVRGALPVSSWGTPRDLTTWSGRPVAGLMARQRGAELAALAQGERLSARAARELLALQSSDWAFLITRDTAGPYPRERADGHLAAFARALAEDAPPELRNLAPHLNLALLAAD